MFAVYRAGIPKLLLAKSHGCPCGLVRFLHV